MKLATACTQCRLAKKKCLQRDGQRSCAYCRLKGLSSQCSIVVDAAKRQPPSQHSSAVKSGLGSLSSEASNLLTTPTRVDLVDLYLAFIHDRPQTIFHAPTLRKQVRMGYTSEALLLALCSLGCRFSTQDSLRSLEGPMTKACKTALHVKLSSKDIEVVQACILVANLCAANMDPDGEALYFGACAANHFIARTDLGQALPFVSRES